MHVMVNGVRLFFDVAGDKLVPDGLQMRERPIVLLLHGGPGFDFPLYHQVPEDSAWMQRSICNLAVSIHFFDGEGKVFDFRPHLGRIGCPTLVVGGAKDPRCPPAFTRISPTVSVPICCVSRGSMLAVMARTLRSPSMSWPCCATSSPKRNPRVAAALSCQGSLIACNDQTIVSGFRWHLIQALLMPAA